MTPKLVRNHNILYLFFDPLNIDKHYLYLAWTSTKYFKYNRN